MNYKNVFLIVIFLASFFYYPPNISAEASYQINNHISYIDAKGTYHIIGEIENNGSINLLFIRITATFYDINRQVVASNFTYSNLNMLLVGEKTSFNLIFIDTKLIPLIDSYTLEVDFQETSSTKPIKLVIKSHHNYSGDMGSQHILGTVENQGSFTELIKVLVIGYDRYGRVVTTESNYTNPINLDQNQVAQFNLTITHDRASLLKGYVIIAESQDYHSNMIINVNVPIIVMFKEAQILDLVKNLGVDINYICQFKPAISGLINMGLIDTLRKHPAVEYIVYDIPIELLDQTLPWGVERIGAPVVHTSGNKGTGINVAVLDTGIDTDHPDLSFIFGYDFSGRFINDPDPQDFQGHGTHVAGIIAALDNDIGVVGVAPEVNLYILKTFADIGLGSYSASIEALEWCINTYHDDIEGNEIQVVSMSWGSNAEFGDPGIEPWINQAYEQGIVLVAAAGNEGDPSGSGDNVVYPARYQNVIAVAATNEDDKRPGFSSTGSSVELAAPGLNIPSTYIGGYANLSGASMACAYVSGTVALILNTNVDPNYDQNNNGKWDPIEVRNILHDTADDLGLDGVDDEYGYGLIDADEAYLIIPEFHYTSIVVLSVIAVSLSIIKRNIVRQKI